MNRYEKVSHVGLDCHRNFTQMTARDSGNAVLFRQRLEHGDRGQMRQTLERFPAGTPFLLEGTFGWGWMADELKECRQDPHLASSRISSPSSPVTSGEAIL